MPRKRTDTVIESRAELLELERRSSASRRSRVKALRLIKEKPNDRLSDIADSMGVSITALGRWWALYRQGGLDALLETKRRGGYRPSKVDDQLIETIRSLRERGELTSQRDVQQWLQKEHGLTVSRSGVAYMLKRHVADTPPRTVTGAGPKMDVPQRPQEGGSAGATDADHLLNLLNNLPRHHDIPSWVEAFREVMAPLLHDVTRISVDVNTRCDLLDPGGYRPDMVFSQYRGVVTNNSEVSVTGVSGPGDMARMLIRTFGLQGLPLEGFHPPDWREYYYEGTAYLGTLIFWRDRAAPPISEETLALVDRLEPFVVFLLSDLVARYDYAHPVGRVFHDILSVISEECKLSFQERRVLGLQLMGESYKAIAAQLEISQNAVRKHLTSVHRKTDTRSIVQLFAKYFTPRLSSLSQPSIPPNKTVRRERKGL